MEQVLILVGAGLLVMLGVMHLLTTVFKTDFDPEDPQLKESMQRGTVKMSKDLPIYPMWIGLNMTHSTAVIILGTFLVLLAGFHMDFLATAPVFLLFAIGVGVFFMGLAKKYFFLPPFIFLTFSTALFSVAAVRLYL